MKKGNGRKIRFLAGLVGLLGFCSSALALHKTLVLQELSWPEVKEYLKTSDMVIIPLGSTEQHGPHLPLGTDYFEALELSKLVSKKTGVLVAPMLLVGYSEYHSGFPGTLSLKPETMEQVLMENVEMLIKYGFRRFLYLNYHGGNNIVQDRVIHRINQTTEAVAIAIGVGSSIQKGKHEIESFDYHAGLKETSLMLYLKPKLVKMHKAEKPTIRLTPRMKKLKRLAKKHPELMHVFNSLLGVCEQTKKGGASHEVSTNGIWSEHDPATSTREHGKQVASSMVEKAVKFIQLFKTL